MSSGRGTRPSTRLLAGMVECLQDQRWCQTICIDYVPSQLMYWVGKAAAEGWAATLPYPLDVIGIMHSSNFHSCGMGNRPSVTCSATARRTYQSCCIGPPHEASITCVVSRPPGSKATLTLHPGQCIALLNQLVQLSQPSMCNS
jgi:hypothetical protein